jgi:hypothetical protein
MCLQRGVKRVDAPGVSPNSVQGSGLSITAYLEASLGPMHVEALSESLQAGPRRITISSFAGHIQQKAKCGCKAELNSGLKHDGGLCVSRRMLDGRSCRVVPADKPPHHLSEQHHLLSP